MPTVLKTKGFASSVNMLRNTTVGDSRPRLENFNGGVVESRRLPATSNKLRM